MARASRRRSRTLSTKTLRSSVLDVRRDHQGRNAGDGGQRHFGDKGEGVRPRCRPVQGDESIGRPRLEVPRGQYEERSEERRGEDEGQVQRPPQLGPQRGDQALLLSGERRVDVARW